MNVQVIERDGQPEYAVLAWAEYLQLLAEAGRRQPESRAAAEPAAGPVFELARLAEWREARGLSQEQLARAVGHQPALPGHDRAWRAAAGPGHRPGPGASFRPSAGVMPS